MPYLRYIKIAVLAYLTGWLCHPILAREIPSHSATKQTLTKLKQQYPEQPRIVINFLVKHSGKQAVPALIEALHDRNNGIRYYAICTLGESRDARAIKPLATVLRDRGTYGESDWGACIARTAADALRSFGERALPTLIPLTYDHDLQVRGYAVSLLGNIGNERVINLLLTRVKSRDALIRYEALSALKEIGAKAKSVSLSPLLPLLKVGTTQDKQQAIQVLGSFNDPCVIAPIVRCAVGNADLSEAAITALEWYGDARAIPVFQHALGSSDAYIRQKAIYALGWINDPRAYKLLIDSLKTSDADIAANALAHFPSRGIADALVRELFNPNREIRIGVINALGYRRDHSVTLALVPLLKEPDQAIRVATVHALGQIDDERAIVFLAPLLDDDDNDVRKETRRALTHIVSQDLGASPHSWISWLEMHPYKEQVQHRVDQSWEISRYSPLVPDLREPEYTHRLIIQLANGKSEAPFTHVSEMKASQPLPQHAIFSEVDFWKNQHFAHVSDPNESIEYDEFIRRLADPPLDSVHPPRKISRHRPPPPEYW